MAEETQTLDETLNKSDFGHWIYENRKLLFVVIGLMLASGIGYSVYTAQQSKAESKSLAAIYSLNTETVTPFVQGKIKYEEFNTKWSSLPAHIWAQSNMIPTVFKAVDKMIELDKKAEALVLLEKLQVNFSTDAMKSFFINIKLATTFENLGENAKALSTYETIQKSKFNPIESRIYLSIGRLHKLLGNTDKSNENFNYLIEKFPNSEDAKLAKLYQHQ